MGSSDINHESISLGIRSTGQKQEAFWPSENLRPLIQSQQHHVQVIKIWLELHSWLIDDATIDDGRELKAQ